MKLLPLLIITGFIALAAFRVIPATHKRVGKQIEARAVGVEFISLELERMERGQ